MIFLAQDWGNQRFSGKARDGVATLEDKYDTWHPILEAITAVLR